ncbi:MAG: hypothetical protein HKL91_00955 [Candidatus Eremiobacteraeota bacterium]|nr:hypothetical protein [Candidatus Eremiobacteraeota bacterium]
MKSVEMHVDLPLPASAAHDEAMEIFAALGRHEPPFDELALAIGLRSLHIPVGGEVRIPVSTQVELAPTRWEATIELAAVDHPGLFPRFQGTLTLNPVGPMTSELWLQGTYTAPLGALGEGFDAALLHGAAERSLRELLERISAGLVTKIREREESAARRARGLT